MKKIMLCCLIISFLVSGCSRKTEKEEKTGEIAEDISLFFEDETIQPQDDDKNPPVKIRIYQIYDNEYNYQTVELSRDNFTENAINYLNFNTGFQVKNIRYEGTRLIVDFDRFMITRFEGAGSSGGLHLSNSILHSFSSFPDAAEMKFLFDGEEDLWGDHFSFKGIFPAGSHIWTGAKIEKSDITGLWESEDDNRHIFYFMPDNIYKEGRKESSWDRIGRWELIGNMLTITVESGAYEKLENPIIEHLIISIFDDKLTLNYSDILIKQLIKSDYIQ